MTQGATKGEGRRANEPSSAVLSQPSCDGTEAIRGEVGQRSSLPLRWFMLVVMLGCAGLAFPARASAEEQESDSNAAVSDEEFARPADETLAERIDTLVALIGSPDYALRTSASEELIAIGAPAFAQLQESYRETEDLEVVLQIERIVQAAFLNQRVFSRHGFLGVSLAAFPRSRRDSPKITLPEGTAAVELARVIENTGASRAGLKVKDVIIAVDGTALEGAGMELVNHFSRGISTRGPGDKMILTVVRTTGQLEIEVTLGPCPPELARSGSVRAVYQRLQKANQQFQQWWPRNFRESVAPSPTNTTP